MVARIYMRKWLVVLSVLAAWAGTAWGQPVSVLVTGQFIRLHSPFLENYRAACQKDGVEVHFAAPEYGDLTSDLLKRFQVVVFHGTPVGSDDRPQSGEEAAAFVRRLEEYRRAGGGILWMPVAFKEWPERWTAIVGKQYDVQALVEDLYDPANVVDVNPEIGKTIFRYIWTTHVSRHAVTEGVRGLFLPLTGEWSWPGTVPMKFGKSWQVLVSGMDTTATIRLASPGSGKSEFKPELKGAYAAAPQVVGVREGVDGGGRMMVFPIYSAHTFQNFHHPVVYNDALMLNGYGGRPSDGYRLLLNAYRWLAEPASKAGLGGFVAAAKRPARSAVPAVDWRNAAFPANSWSGMGAWWKAQTQTDVAVEGLATPGARDFRGVFGVRTAASDGKGTVAEYVAEARRLGLSFLVFLENLEKLDEARYAALAADCKANCADDFAAVPGFIYRDTRDVAHFVFFTEVLPLPGNLTPERRVIVPNEITVNQNPSGYGAEGIAGLGGMKLDPWFLLTFSCIAPYVYDGGKLVDDGLASYLSLQGRMHIHPPVSLTIVRSPAELAETVKAAHVTVIHAESLSSLKPYLMRKGPFSPNPVYITAGPVIERWGELNAYGHPFGAGKQRVRFALEARSESGLADVRILDAGSGAEFRHFRPAGATSFSCTIDETHKDQWRLVPVVTDVNGRTAIGPTAETYQDGNRLSPYRDNIDAGHLVIGWDERRERLVQFGGWAGAWHKGRPTAGACPPNTRSEELGIYGFDGGKVFPSAIDILPRVETDAGSEPAFPTLAFSPVRLASFDYAVVNYDGRSQFKADPKEGFKIWWPTPEPQVPNEIVDIDARTWAVRARYHAAVASNVHEITFTFKKDCALKRASLAGLRMWRSPNPLVMVGDREGDLAWLVEPGQRFSRQGVLDPGGYLYPANERGGAVGVVNLGPEPIDYRSGDTRSELYLAGNGRTVKAGEKITVRFLAFTRPWQGQNTNQWLRRFIADFAVGGGKPGYAFDITQGALKTVNYAIDLEARDGGAAAAVRKYDLPHSLLVRVSGIPANAVAGRYDPARKQLLILPVFEGTATTSINTTLGDTRLYIGELFHCDDDRVVLSAAQDGPDKLLLEVHNPGDAPRKVVLSPVPGFAVWKDLPRSLDVAPYSSVKLALESAPGALADAPYQGD